MANTKTSERVVDTIAGILIFLGMWFFTGLILFMLTSRLTLANKSLIMGFASFSIALMVFGYYRYQNFKNVKVSQSYIEFVASTKRRDYLGRTVMNYGEMEDLPLMDIFTFDINGDNFIGQFVLRRRNNYSSTMMISDKKYKELTQVMMPLIELEEKTCLGYWEIFDDYSGAEEGFNKLEGLPKNFIVGYYPLYNQDIMVEKESPLKQLEKILERVEGERQLEEIMDGMFLEYYKDITLESLKNGDLCNIDYCIVCRERLFTIKVVSEGYVSYVVDSAGYVYDEGKKVNQEKQSLMYPINRQNELLREIYGKFMRITNLIVFTGDNVGLKNNLESPTVYVIQPYKLQNILHEADQEDARDHINMIKSYVVEDRMTSKYDLLDDYNTMVEQATLLQDRLDQTVSMLADSEDFLFKRKVAYKEWAKQQRYIFMTSPKYVKRFEKHVDMMFSLKHVFGVDNISTYKSDLSKAKTLISKYLSVLTQNRSVLQNIMSDKDNEKEA